jgi:hypothetical protein
MEIMTSENKDSGQICLGCHVELELIARSGKRETLQFDLVPDDQADYQAGFLGVSTPLARAILGEKPGALIPYFTEDLQAVEILSVTAATREPSSAASAQRKRNIQETKSQLEFRDALLFASSAGTKWGDYDADGLDYEKWVNPENQPKENPFAED